MTENLKYKPEKYLNLRDSIFSELIQKKNERADLVDFLADFNNVFYWGQADLDNGNLEALQTLLKRYKLTIDQLNHKVGELTEDL